MNTARTISLLYRKMNSMTNTRFSALNLSSAKAIFLLCIHDHKIMSQVEICRELEMDKSSVAKMLMRLEKDGFITKTVNPEDTRSMLISLTDKADSLIPSAQAIVNDWVEESTSCLTDLERRNFYELLEKVGQHITETMK